MTLTPSQLSLLHNNPLRERSIYNAKHGQMKKKMTPGNAFMTHMRGMKKLRELLKNLELMA